MLTPSRGWRLLLIGSCRTSQTMKKVWFIVQKKRYILQQAGSKTSKRTPVKKFYPLWNCYAMTLDGEVYWLDFMIQKWTATVSLCLLKTHGVRSWWETPPPWHRRVSREEFLLHRGKVDSFFEINFTSLSHTHKHKSFPIEKLQPLFSVKM